MVMNSGMELATYSSVSIPIAKAMICAHYGVVVVINLAFLWAHHLAPASLRSPCRSQWEGRGFLVVVVVA